MESTSTLPDWFRPGGSVSTAVEASAEEVWQLVADVTRIGEWSPECHRAAWIDGADGPAVGARFRGHNRWKLNRWSRVCEVVEAEPGRAFAFRTVPGFGPSADSTTWRYDIVPTDGGCEVMQSYEITTPPKRWFQPVIRRLMPHHLDMRPHMSRTLEAIRDCAEGRVGESDPVG
jgi:hypothetical protein